MASATASSSQRSIPETKVVLATTEEQIKECYAIRIEVFVDEQKYPMETEIDDRDPHCAHFLLFADLPSESNGSGPAPENHWKAVGTVRYDPQSHKLGRLAVLKNGRGFGYGRVLVQALHEYAAGVEAVNAKFSGEKTESLTVKAGAQVYAIPFYEKLGYASTGERYLDEGEPHQMMKVVLPLKST